MTRLPLFLACLLLGFSAAYSQAKIFSKTLGGVKDEVANCALVTRDSGYVVAGYTYSFAKGQNDVWLVRMDAQGKELWRQTYGGVGQEWANAVVETRDGGFVVAGYARDPKTRISSAWVFRTDKVGKLVWEHTYGGEHASEAKAIIETDGGGYVVVGSTGGGGTNGSATTKSDMWLLRLTPSGETLWNRTFGKEADEYANGLVQLPDGDYILAGYTESLGNGKKDMLLVRVSNAGKEKWMRPFGGAEDEEAECILRLKDGNLVLGGSTGSATKGKHDGKILKITPDGNVIWERSFGGTEDETILSATNLADGSIAFTGWSRSFGITPQVWAMKLSPEGKIAWERNYGGERGDYGRAIVAAKDGGFLIAGGTESSGAGGRDFWILKTDENGEYEQPQVVAATSTPAAGTAAATTTPPTTPNTRPTTSTTETSLFKPNLYVLAVGVSHYQDESVNLSFAHVDAEAVADKFKLMEGKIYNKVFVKKITNEDATLVNIKTGINWLEQEATQKDVILIFLSSHGALDNKGNLYILPTDFNQYNLFATALNIKDVTDGMSGAPCKKLILLDACHSGQSGADLMATKAVNVEKIVQEVLSAEPGLTVMTSSSGKEYSYETPKWGHGAFTKAILEALESTPSTQNADYNKDGVISLAELNLFVTDRVKTLTGGRQHPFTPINLFGDIPLFILE